MVSIINQVIGNMSSMPPGSELDINNVTLRLALDINGACFYFLACCNPERLWQCPHCQLLGLTSCDQHPCYVL